MASAIAHNRIRHLRQRHRLRIERIHARQVRIHARQVAERQAAERRAEAAAFSGGAGYTGVAKAIAECESGGSPTAQNPSSSASGLYQFVDGTWTSVTGLSAPASAYSPATQTAAFWKLWDGGAGAHNWSASSGCW